MLLPATTAALIEDPAVSRALADDAMLAAAMRFEIALAEAAGETGDASAEAVEAVRTALAGFTPDRAAIVAAMPVDGVPVPELMRQLKRQVSPVGLPALHIGATSQDVVDTALILALRDINELLSARIATLEASLGSLHARFGDRPLMAQTRMQAALPITAGDRIAAWASPLPRHRARLAELSPRLLVLQYGGPVGVRSAAGDRIAASLARRLDLTAGPVWQSARDAIGEYAAWLALVSGSLGKIGQDAALMAQAGTLRLAAGGSSSAMPHKQNPVTAETLVALARLNAGTLGTLMQAMVHEQERSGAAWTLEWLTLPTMLHATATGLRLAVELVDAVAAMGDPA